MNLAYGLVVKKRLIIIIIRITKKKYKRKEKSKTKLKKKKTMTNIYRIAPHYIGVTEISRNALLETRGLRDFPKGESGIKCDCII